MLKVVAADVNQKQNINSGVRPDKWGKDLEYGRLDRKITLRQAIYYSEDKYNQK